MGDPPRTYVAPPAGAGATGVEDYVVEARDGARVGTVVTATQQDGERWLIVEAGTPPVRRKRRIVPWADVQDHDALVVRLGRSTSPPRSRRAPRRSGALPSLLTAWAVPTGESAGPRDRSLWVVALASALVGILVLLGLVIAFSLKDVGDTWAWALLVIPAVLLGIAAVTAYRLWRDPYERRDT